MINDSLFKIRQHIPAFIRGCLFYIRLSLKRGCRIQSVPRVGKRSDIVIHPSGQLLIGKEFVCGKNSTIAVTQGGVIKLGDRVGIGNNNQVVCHGHISIGSDTILGPNVMIFDHNHTFDSDQGVHRNDYNDGEIEIGNACWIGANCVILKGVKIGDKCIIGAGSIVTKDVPSDNIAIGNPAHIYFR